MPELPEVEFCARHLRRWTSGRVISTVEAEAAKPLRDLTPEVLRQGLVGARFDTIERVGKQLIIGVGDHELTVHLGMTGKFLPHAEPRAKAVRIRIGFTDGSGIDFHDSRRFGRVRLFKRGEAKRHPELARLGPDALILLAAPDLFCARIQRTRRAIKVALMDQSILAGVGNIYAAEGLFFAGIDPRRSASSLSVSELARLALHVRGVMTRSLERETGLEINYLPEKGSVNPFVIYGRKGAPCPECSTPIERVVQATRATFFCPVCQG